MSSELRLTWKARPLTSMIKRSAAQDPGEEIVLECAGESAHVGGGSVATVAGIGAVMSTTCVVTTTFLVHTALYQSVLHVLDSGVIQRVNRNAENGGVEDTHA